MSGLSKDGTSIIVEKSGPVEVTGDSCSQNLGSVVTFYDYQTTDWVQYGFGIWVLLEGLGHKIFLSHDGQHFTS